MATRNAFTLRGALGGVMAADKDLLDKKSQELEQTNMAIKAMAAADQFRRDRQFAAKERQMKLDRQKEALITDVRDNKIGELYDESDRATAAKTKKATARIKTEEADLKEEFGKRETVANIEGREADTLRTTAETKAIPKRIAQRWKGLSLQERNTDLRAAEATQRRTEYQEGEEARNIALAKSRYQMAVDRLEADVANITDPKELAARRSELENLKKQEREARIEDLKSKTDIRNKTGGSKSKNMQPITPAMEKTAWAAILRMQEEAPFSSEEERNNVGRFLAARVASLSNTGKNTEEVMDLAVSQLKSEGRVIKTPKWTFDTEGGVPVKQLPHWKYIPDAEMRSAPVGRLEALAMEAPDADHLKALRRAYQAKYDKDVPKEILDKYPGMQ